MARGTNKRSGLGALRLLQLVGAQAILLAATPSWADGAALQTNHVSDVKVHVADAKTGAAEIEVQGSAAPIFNMRVENAGKRLVVDITGADVVGAK